MSIRLSAGEDALQTWRERRLPEPGWPVGYAVLVEHFALNVPFVRRPALVTERHRPHEHDAWAVFPRRMMPDDTFDAHLEFALKYEGISLGVLKALFETLRAEPIAAFVRATPTGKYARRVWFLYEWLTGNTLDLPDLSSRPSTIDVVDLNLQVGLTDGEVVTRQAVRNNLPGTPQFCPIVTWTDVLRQCASAALAERARDVIGRTHPDVIARAAAFLLLDDSRASFEIEGERPAHDRIRRWGNAIAEAGGTSLSIEELERLQRIVIGDSRFVRIGLRQEGGFVGDRDRRTGEPIPRHISARPEDLRDLLSGIVRYDEQTRGASDAIASAAALAFGFAYIHPFEDGNGRIHRWLVHHVLAREGFNPTAIPFPISSTILRNLTAYREVLESYSKPLLNYINYEVTERKNVRVVNYTADYYRYFDATVHAEFLYRCVQEAIEVDLPREVAYLEAIDAFSDRVQHIVDMPSDTVHLLHRFLEQNDGQLSKRARNKEFAALTDEEAAEIETIYADVRAD